MLALEKWFGLGNGWKLPLSCASSIVAVACVNASVLLSDRGPGWSLLGRYWMRMELGMGPGFSFLPDLFLRSILEGLDWRWNDFGFVSLWLDDILLLQLVMWKKQYV
jgi:hypothetical protein